MSDATGITQNDVELLSSYIDGALTDAEQSAVEARLREDSAFKNEYDNLRQTIALIQQLPVLQSPRNFTLTEEMVQPHPAPIVDFPVQRKRTPPYLSWIAAVAAVFVLFAGGLLVLNNPGNQSSATAVAMGATSPAILETSENTANQALAQATTATQNNQDTARTISEPPAVAADDLPDEQNEEVTGVVENTVTGEDTSADTGVDEQFELATIDANPAANSVANADTVAESNTESDAADLALEFEANATQPGEVIAEVADPEELANERARAGGELDNIAITPESFDEALGAATAIEPLEVTQQTFGFAAPLDEEAPPVPNVMQAVVPEQGTLDTFADDRAEIDQAQEETATSNESAEEIESESSAASAESAGEADSATSADGDEEAIAPAPSPTLNLLNRIIDTILNLLRRFGG